MRKSIIISLLLILMVLAITSSNTKLDEQSSLELPTFVEKDFMGDFYGDSNNNSSTHYDNASEAAGGTKVHFIDVGQADAILIELAGNKNIVIDGGNTSDGETVVNYLKEQGVDDIELLIATHPHEDHMGGLPDVLKNFVVERVIDSGQTADTATYNMFMTAVQTTGAIYEQDAYQLFIWGDVNLKILTGHDYWEEVNDYSVVCRLDTGDIEFLFMGDAESSAEANLYGDISAEILKVGHHGSDTGTTQSFLEKIDPKAAIISVGTGNEYGHPSDEVLTRLKSNGVEIYRTDEMGSIIVTTNGSKYSIDSSLTRPVQNPVVEPVKKPEDSGRYIGNKNSKKYHQENCKSLPKPANQIFFATEEEAVQAGYQACKRCKP